MTTTENAQKPEDTNEKDPNAPQEVNYSEKYPNYKLFKFPDNSVYYGEIAYIIPNENKIIKNPEQEVPDEEKRKTLQMIRHGFGIMLYELKEDGKYSSKYEGRWYLNKKKGKGKCQYKDGSYYEGTFDEDLYEGTGTYIWKKGYRYKGQWVQGRMEGEGEFRHYDGHVYKGNFRNNYFYDKEHQCYVYPYNTSEEMESFILKNADYISKTKSNSLEKFSLENSFRVSDQVELMTAIEETYKFNKIPLILRSNSRKLDRGELYNLFVNYREIDLRHSYLKLHESSYGINMKVFEDIKQNVTEAMTKGFYLILNFDDCYEKCDFDPDIREFYGVMMLSPFMWNPSLFSQTKCSNAHLDNRPDLKMDKNFKLVCYSKYLIDDAASEQDILHGLEKRFEKSLPMANMNVIIITEKKC